MNFTMNEHGFQTNFEYEELKISSQDEYGFRPYQLLVSSIAGYSCGVLRKVLQKIRVSFDAITIKAETERIF